MKQRLEELIQRRSFVITLLFVGVIGVWGRSLSYSFVWDDKFFIKNLPSIRSLSHIPEMFYSLSAQSSYPEGFKLFRPLRTVVYALLFQLSGAETPKPWLYHAMNLLWHFAASTLLYAATLRLTRIWAPSSSSAQRAFGALVASLAFAIHPVMSEVVCWAKSLDDAMATTFVLASLLSILRQPPENLHLGWPISWFILAVYSKISAVPFAMAVFPIFWLGLKLPWRTSIGKTIPFLVAALIFMIHRRMVIGQDAQTAPISGTHIQTLIDTVATGPIYGRLIIGLPPFYIDYSFLPYGRAISSGAVLAGLGMLLALAFVVYWSWHREDWQFLASGAFWFGVFMLPVSNLLPMMQYMAERFLYLPIVGLLFVLGVLLARLQITVPRFMGIAAVLLFWGATASTRSEIWSDELTLFVTSSQQGPKIKRVEQNAVAAIFELPEMASVFQLDERSRKLRILGMPPASKREAIAKTLAQGLLWYPDDVSLRNASGIFNAVSGRYAKAEGDFRALSRTHPEDADAWANLGRVESELNEITQARSDLRRALSLQTNHLDALHTVAALEWKTSNYVAARETFQRLKILEPGNTNNDYWIEQANKLSK